MYQLITVFFIQRQCINDIMRLVYTKTCQTLTGPYFLNSVPLPVKHNDRFGLHRISFLMS